MKQPVLGFAMCGSFFCTHSSLGAVNPAKAMFAVSWDSFFLPMTSLRYATS